MARWRPDSRRRLQDAAVDLYAERGFAETTVAQVAERAGLTERTFFRHFADKREVLFANEDALRAALADAVAAADADATTSEAVLAGLDAVAADLQPRRDELRRRTPIVAATPELGERELQKLASWRAALQSALLDRGVDAATAHLASEVGIAVLNVAAQAWLAADDEGDLAAGVRARFAALRELA
ncbi:TetR family transcriptional regulator [Patulibacter minatonensis]|uniref:TetR family transcriptional regulator n=1 Tax=Patulibacter minatonensis TaxID=298163 RepID=UPI00047BA110|nr:TetR family transcriptional regulator [Patulibacter minatonensis]